MTSLTFSKFNLSAAISNIYAQFAPVSRVVYSAYFTFNNFSKVLPVCAIGVIKNLNINFFAAIGNIYAHIAPVNRGLN